jgi:hypothetical protein
MKIYDSCRYKNCLSQPELGAARDETGRIIEAPEGAQSASVDNLRVRKIIVLNKQPSRFRNGYWDAEVKYLFEYDLSFTGQEGIDLGTVSATNSHRHRFSLFGSVGQDITISTDLFGTGGGQMDGDPFILIEAKAISLTAEISDECHPRRPGPPRPNHVFVTIGLFSIIKLCRMVSLLVESRGFVIPSNCRGICPPNPCDFFETLDFPMDAFAPPQKTEFMSGISANIPAEATPCGERERERDAIITEEIIS